MSVARVHVQKTRKEWTCDKCGKTIKKGEERRTWAVGFRGRKQNRCMDCPAPLTSELESSAVSSVYAAIEGADFDTATTKEDLDEMIGDITGAIDEVASDYESNEMFEKNYDLQERVDTLNAASSELFGWDDSLDDEPEEGTEEHDEWMENARQTARDAVDGLELP